MDNRNSQEATKEDQYENKKETEENIQKGKVVTIKINDEDAGPSQLLPGSKQPSPRLIRSGRSKSEHSIAHIITKQDVENALKLTSLSFAVTNNRIKNLNLKDLKMPGENTDDNSKVNTEVKRFVASCFNSKVTSVHNDNSNVNSEVKRYVANCFNSKETPVTMIPQVPVRVVNVVTNEMQELPNSTSEAQTDSIPIPDNLNEVIITKQPVVGTKLSKAGPDKKKLSDKKIIPDLGTSNVDSLSSIGSNVCRICMTRGRERLISPCNCKGSLANVHLSCLERWLNQVGRNHCELCGFSYPAIRTPRYTVLQALRLWFGNPRNRSHLQSDCLIFWLLSTVTAGLLAVCIVGTQYFVIEGSKFGKPEPMRKEEGISHRITETAMDFFMAVVLCGYSVTVYLLWKDHYVMWNRWRRANVNVRLLLSPDTSVPFVPNSRYNVV